MKTKSRLSLVRLELKRTNSDTPTAIILHYQCHDGHLKYYTGRSVHPSRFNPDNYIHYSQFIEQIQAQYDLLGRRLSRADLKDRLNKYVGKQSSTKNIDDILHEMNDGTILTDQKKKYTPGTIKSMKNAARVIKDCDPGLDLNNITLDFYDKLINYCYSQGFSLNYTGTVIKRLKTFMRVLGIPEISKSFKILREDTTGIYLTQSEIGKIAAVNVDARELLARDWFVLGCYLGLRVSDLLRLGKLNIVGNKVIIATKKTGTRVAIPLHPKALEILSRHDGFPSKITDQELNRNIKFIAEQAGINDVIVYSNTKSGKRQDIYFKKYEMISTHTCRRTFITNLLASGVQDSIVMMLAGIKSHATLRKYNKLSPEDAANIASNSDFFTPQE